MAVAVAVAVVFDDDDNGNDGAFFCLSEYVYITLRLDEALGRKA